MQQNGNEHCNQKENTSIGIGRSFKTIDGCNKIGHLIQSFAVVLQRFNEVSWTSSCGRGNSRFSIIFHQTLKNKH